MSALSRRVKANRDLVDAERSYPLPEALDLLGRFARARFDEAVEIAINLGIDTRQSDQQVRGATLLPHGNGRTVSVAVFAEGDAATAASEAGADFVGADDLVEQVKGGMMDFDTVIATPEAMRIVAALGPKLGPRGLMPNPKSGTVTADVATAVRNAKQGQLQYRADKQGVVHGCIGRISFSASALTDNLLGLLADLKKSKPAKTKGIYLKKLSLSTTMSPGIAVDLTNLKF